jgi:phosphoglycolate phosphatase-like HAD superfamily hydrolase
MLLELKVSYFSEKWFYVGDRFEDYVASKDAQMNFIHANWGYCNLTELIPESCKILNPVEIRNKLNIL